MKIKLIYILIFFWLIACIREVDELSRRSPASKFAFKVITYEENALQCKGFYSKDDVEGTIIETIPLGRSGQAPVSICNESIGDLRERTIYIE